MGNLVSFEVFSTLEFAGASRVCAGQLGSAVDSYGC